MKRIRKIGVASAACAIAALACLLIIFPDVHAVPFGRAAAVLAVIVIGLGGRHVWLRPGWHFMVLILAALCVLPVLVITDHFGKFDLLAVTHHMLFDGGGPDINVFRNEIQDASIALFAFLLANYWLRNVLQASARWFWGAALALLTVNPMGISVIQMGLMSKADIELRGRLSTPTVFMPTIKPDLIMVYLEGLDRGFANQERFGDVYDGLLSVQAEGLDLTQVAQIEGTGWSLAGLVATQCGVPLLPNGFRQRNAFEDQTTFMPSQTCLSDVLADHGYRTSFVVASDSAFAGQRHFLRSHQYDDIVDSDTLEAWYHDDDLARAFVPSLRTYDDQLAYDVAQRHYDDILTNPAPIALTVMTFGPHGRSGVLSRRCTQDGVARREGDLMQTVPCAISDFQTFLTYIRAHRSGRPTLVAVMSDHLNHERDVVGQAGRMNTVTFLGYGIPDFPTSQKIDRPAAMIDVYPTVLALLGFADKEGSAGLGVSVLGREPTLLGLHGLELLNDALLTEFDLRVALWR